MIYIIHNHHKLIHNNSLIIHNHWRKEVKRIKTQETLPVMFLFHVIPP